MIGDEAVEAAARGSYESVRYRMGFPTGFNDAPEPLQRTYRDIARAAIMAAAQHMSEPLLALANQWDADCPYKANQIREALGAPITPIQGP